MQTADMKLAVIALVIAAGDAGLREIWAKLQRPTLTPGEAAALAAIAEHSGRLADHVEFLSEPGRIMGRPG